MARGGRGTRILVDPVVEASFGHSPRLRFEIHPARRIDLDLMPRVDAVVVTNEHLDHFHLPSLRRLPMRRTRRHAPVDAQGLHR